MSQNHYDISCQALGVAIRCRTPILLWGAPGQGKTSVIKSIAEQQDANLVTILASIREPSDFAGLPNVVGSRTELIAPGWAQDIAAHDGESILFFDEISTAPPATQSALLRVVLDRVVGDLPLGENVSILAAANPPEQATDGWDLAPPMANRFVHLDWALPASVVQMGLMTGWPTVTVPEMPVEDASDYITEAKILIGSFLGVRQDYTTVIPDSASESGRAFPTPRSWETAALLYGYCNAVGADATVTRVLLVGTVGQAAAGEFLTYIHDMDLPDAEEVLARPKSWKIPERGDKVYAVAASIYIAVKNNTTPERWKQMGDVLAEIANHDHADIAVSVGRLWIELRPENSLPPASVVKSLRALFKELNLVG